jgi:NitT/TauT family transport system substrate-binding protein
MSVLTFLVLVGASILVACGGREAEKGNPDTVRLALNWFPEAEHGGFYAAEVHDLYRTRNVDVEIIGGGPEAPVMQRVATGAVEFGVTNADDVLNFRAQEAPVVAVMAPYQINPRCIMVHSASGIERIAEIGNITLALSQRPAFSHYLQKKYSFPGVKLVPYPGNVTQFLLDPNFAQQAYVFSEPFVARSQGAEPRALLVSDTGFNPYASVLITTEETIARRPELVREIVQATVDGWRIYLDDPAKTNAHIHRLNPEMGLDILDFGARESRPLVLDEVAEKNGIGHMSLERWQTLRDQMIEAELIQPGAIDVDRAFTTEFLDK